MISIEKASEYQRLWMDAVFLETGKYPTAQEVTKVHKRYIRWEERMFARSSSTYYSDLTGLKTTATS